ncbi:MAG: sigma-54-dependent Fis family transcriptional regulator [Planctomycetaceae bacterium]|nr:sigma-54-dependent Fis family transcriptional regulator [Planctomycetaceae bacterium]
MPIFKSRERAFARALSESVFLNPFRREELSARLAAAKDRVKAIGGIQESNETPIPGRPDVEPLFAAANNVLGKIGERRYEPPVWDEEFFLLQDMILFVMYYSFRQDFQKTIEASEDAASGKSPAVDYFKSYETLWNQLWQIEGLNRSPDYSCAHTFACLFQIRRAYFHIDEFIWGESESSHSLRADIWDSIFTHDFRRYGLLLFDRMEKIPTLIAGPSGTGKELAARAIGLSRYIPFNARRGRFEQRLDGAFHPVNIAALSPTVIESELFGHSKGSFTGATRDKKGWLETCPPGHSVFLDEIGELPPELQVKLLRVVQNREFTRVGDNTIRKFTGKLIVATNRDLSEEIKTGRFRADLYYRLCADLIHTPALTEVITGSRDRLRKLIQRIVAGITADRDADAARITADAVEVIETSLPADYSWPGNFRELEQCVWNAVIRKSYRPLQTRTLPQLSQLEQAILSGEATAEEILNLYCRRVYAKTGSYAATARIVGLDQRTVKRRVHEAGSMYDRQDA